MPFALYSGIIVAIIRAPCGDCNEIERHMEEPDFCYNSRPLRGL